MLYTIVDWFTPENQKQWNSYIEWRGITFERFDSIDGIMRPALFNCPDDDEWSFVVNENMMLHLMIDYDFALRKHKQIGNGELIGIRLDQHDVESKQFLGFDLIDGCFDISLLTNWGNDNNFINQSLSKNALINNYQVIKKIQNHLVKNFSSDGHVEGCQIVSVYKT